MVQATRPEIRGIDFGDASSPVVIPSADGKKRFFVINDLGKDLSRRSIRLEATDGNGNWDSIFEISNYRVGEGPEHCSISVHAVTEGDVENASEWVHYSDEGIQLVAGHSRSGMPLDQEREIMGAQGHLRLGSLPSVIDTAKTIREFVEQLEAKDFSTPAFVSPTSQAA